jgi:hypothetical protein
MIVFHNVERSAEPNHCGILGFDGYEMLTWFEGEDLQFLVVLQVYLGSIGTPRHVSEP